MSWRSGSAAVDFYGLVLGALVVWRLTHLLGREAGPWDWLAKLRRAAGDGVVGRMLDCFYCLSVWVALPAAWVLGSDLGHRLLLWPALSAGAILLERATGVAELPPAPYVEGDWLEEVKDDELLWTREDDAGRRAR